MAQLIRANRRAAELPQRVTLINLPDGGVGKREIITPHPVSLPKMCAELLDCQTSAKPTEEIK